MYLIEHKNKVFRVTKDFFESKNSLSESDYENQINKFPVHCIPRVVSDKEFADLENKNWIR